MTEVLKTRSKFNGKQGC